MKKIVCLILFLTILTTSFAGCGGNTVHSPDNNNQEQSGNTHVPMILEISKEAPFPYRESTLPSCFLPRSALTKSF